MFLSEKEKFEQACIEAFGNSKSILAQAFINSALLYENDSQVSQLEWTILQRLPGPKNAGSDFGEINKYYLIKRLGEIVKDLDIDDFKRIHETTEKFHSTGDVSPWCRSFEIPLFLDGHSGIIDIKELSENTELYAMQTHGTDICVGARNIDKTPAKNCHIIIGPEDIGSDKMVVYTMFPGPIAPPFMLRDAYLNGHPIEQYQKLTVEEAISLGVTSVKYLSDEMIQEIDNYYILKEIKDATDTFKDYDDGMCEDCEEIGGDIEDI